MVSMVFLLIFITYLELARITKISVEFGLLVALLMLTSYAFVLFLEVKEIRSGKK